jgi:hypothetical protein
MLGVWLLQARKVLRVVCRWDLGANMVQELLMDIKVSDSTLQAPAAAASSRHCSTAVEQSRRHTCIACVS